jgi:hypothetical protein
MATLTRIQNLISSRRASPTPPVLLDTRIPSPFPSLLDRHEQTGELPSSEFSVEPARLNTILPPAPPAPTLTVELAEQTVETQLKDQVSISSDDIPVILMHWFGFIRKFSQVCSPLSSRASWRLTTCLPEFSPMRTGDPSFHLVAIRSHHLPPQHHTLCHCLTHRRSSL